MVFKNYSSKSKVLIILIVVLGVLFIYWFWHSQRTNSNYQIYIADNLSLVFDDQDKGEPRIEKLDFLLADIKRLKNLGKKPAVIGYNSINEDKDFKMLIDQADNIYIDIFSQRDFEQSNASKFKNVFNITQPFELKSYLTENNNLRIIYNKPVAKIDFVFSGQNLEINGQTIKLNDFVVFSIEGVPEYSILKIGDLVINLDSYQNNLTASIYKIIENKALVYSVDNENLLSTDNYSFESGLWADQVADCSAYLAGEPELGMRLNASATGGGKSLELSSKNHFACTLKTFLINPEINRIYKLSFDYRSLQGDQVQYYYNFKNPAGEIQELFQSFNTQDGNWHTFQTIIQPTIADINNFSIYFYAPSDGTKNIVNLYDEIKLISYKLAKEGNIPQLNFPANYSLFNWISLNEGDNLFRYLGNKTNLLENYNYSFEAGLWTDQVIDCSDYLSGEPQLGMGLNNEASQGIKSLELSSKNHFACTLKNFLVNLENDKLYRLSFDYKSIVGNKLQYYYSLKNNLKEEQDEYKTFNSENNNWNTYKTLINPELDNITEFNLYLYAPSDGSNYLVNLYDNIRLEEFAPKEIYSYYLYSQKETNKDITNVKIISQPINIWKQNIKIEGITNSSLLVYPKKYHNQWRVYPYSALKNKPGILTTILNKPIDDKFHFQVDNYSNGFWIDLAGLCENSSHCSKRADGSYDINLVLEHGFSKLNNFFLILLALIIILLTFSFIYDRKN